MFIQTTPPEQADPAQAAAYATATTQFGFLPNWALALGRRPAALAAWQQLNATIRGSMDRRRYELTSIAARSAPPQPSHGSSPDPTRGDGNG